MSILIFVTYICNRGLYYDLYKFKFNNKLFHFTQNLIIINYPKHLFLHYKLELKVFVSDDIYTNKSVIGQYLVRIRI